MNKTHFEVVEDADVRLVDALISLDENQLRSLLHTEAVYTNPNGEVFIGFQNLPVNNPGIYRLKEIQIIERHISFFNNVAVVNAIEKERGRSWKFHSAIFTVRRAPGVFAEVGK